MTYIIYKIKTLSVTQKHENKYIGEQTEYLLENNTHSSNIYDSSKMKNSWKSIEKTMIEFASKYSKKKYNLETHNAVVEALFTQIIKKNDNNDDIILHNKLLKDVAYLFISPKKSIKKFKNSKKKKNNHRYNKYKRHRFHREKYPLREFYRKM